MIKLNNLNTLVDIIDEFDNIDEMEHMDENMKKDKEDLIETLQIFIDDFLESNPRVYESYEFENDIYKHVDEMFAASYDNEQNIFQKFDISELIDEAIDIYFCTHKPRAYRNTFYPCDADYKQLEKNINRNMKKEQPEQKTKAWYEFRHGMLTASSIWKCLSSDGIKNNLIYQKCLPNDKNSSRGVNINSAMHWGHKYEPLSIMLYENEHKTKIAEVGCVRHDTLDFIGASPDGINIKKNHPLYGRALEIKNPVSRELSGIPKFDYWIQMQIQMEVWNFEEVDFLETVFKEYETEEEFNKDGTYNFTEDGKRKGVIVVFSGQQPIYEYMPFDLTCEEGEEWINNIIDKNTQHYSWIQNIYWYLDDISCVLVPRHKKWFEAALPSFQRVWDTIKQERKDGYSHRAPKTRVKKEKVITKSVETQTFDFGQDCEQEHDYEQEHNQAEPFENFKINTAVSSQNNTKILESNSSNIKVLRIRTESFNQAKDDVAQ